MKVKKNTGTTQNKENKKGWKGYVALDDGAEEQPPKKAFGPPVGQKRRRKQTTLDF